MKWQPYPKYKPSGVEWLGEVPEHWVSGRINGLFRLRSGGTPSTDNADYWDGDIPWVSAKDMKSIRVVDTEDHITSAAVRESATSIVPSATVLMVARSGILKHTLPVAIADVPAAINQDIKGLLPQLDRIHGLFFAYWVQAHQPPLLTLWRQQGATVESLDMESVKTTSVPLPPLWEQHVIADFLDRETAKIDTLVAKKRALIDRLKEKRAALISRTVTRGLPPDAARVASLDPHPKLKPSGVDWLDAVPEHWNVKPVKSVAKIGNGSTPNRDNAAYWDNGSYAWLNSAVANRETVSKADEFVTDLALAECHLPRVIPPAVLVGITGEGRTRGMATTLLIEATINQHLAFVKPTPGQTEVGFLRRVFDAAYEYMRSESDGGGSTKGAITCEQIGQLRIPVPPLPEQLVIAHFLDHEMDKIYTLVAKVEAAIERLQEYRTALITATVTGKIDVRGEVP